MVTLELLDFYLDIADVLIQDNPYLVDSPSALCIFILPYKILLIVEAEMSQKWVGEICLSKLS